MITKDNYIEKTRSIDLNLIPENIKKGHLWVLKATENGSNWNAYENPNIKAVIDKTIQMMNEAISQKETAKENAAIEKKETKVHSEPVKKENTVKPEKVKPVKKVIEEDDKDDIDWVERIPDEIKFLRRFIGMNNKRKSKEEILRFINSLHKAIIEKKVRKSSPYSKQIEYIQEKLIATFNSMPKSILIQVSDKTFSEYKTLISSEKVMPSVSLIKRYINLNGKYGVKEKAKLLMEAMKRAARQKRITKNEKYAQLLDLMFKNLNKYVNSKAQKILSIEQTELNGLNGMLGECGCKAMNGIDDDTQLESFDTSSETVEKLSEKPEVMNSMDFSSIQFKTLGFVGKYRKLIGDPSKGFSAMVYGKPKMGKSYLCVDFAGYLARNHGKVLYIAKEEGLDMTLQQKLKAKDVAHPNLFVAEEIPADLNDFDFIFLDSVNKLGLSAQDLETLRLNYPQKSFIYIFQTTKEGNFRGANEFQHDVDVVIEIPEKGLAIQNGRFNQGGELRIFEG